MHFKLFGSLLVRTNLVENWVELKIRYSSELDMYMNIGFEEGIKDMKPGGKRRIIIPPELGPPVSLFHVFCSILIIYYLCLLVPQKQVFLVQMVSLVPYWYIPYRTQ